MFLKYPRTIDIEQVIKDKYNFTDINNLHKQDFIELEGEGKDALYWIYYNSSKYLFKPIDDSKYNIWGEVLSEEIANILDIPCAEYRVATLGNKTGVITKSFLNEKDTLILGSEVFQKYFNKIKLDDSEFNVPDSILGGENTFKKKYLFNYLNNIESILTIINKLNIMDNSDILKNSLIKILVFDIITLQGDRHANNWGLIKSSNHYTLAPIYDNSASFGLGYPFMERRITNFKSEVMNAKILKDEKQLYQFIYQTAPNLTLSLNNIVDTQTRRKDIPPNVLSDILKIASPDMVEWINEALNKIQDITIDNIINNVEKKLGLSIDDDLFYYIATIFDKNLERLNQVMNENKIHKKK